jgi:SNF2 family DNA or RNA helicase
MANLIEKGLRQNGLLFARIDGQTSLDGRKKALKMFNCDQNCKIMLATIGSAGEGYVQEPISAGQSLPRH